MIVKTRSVELDAATAAILERQAAARGLTLSEFLAEIASVGFTTADVDDAEIAELDEQWSRLGEEEFVPHERVVRWLETLGTPAFRSWQKE